MIKLITMSFTAALLLILATPAAVTSANAAPVFASISIASMAHASSVNKNGRKRSPTKWVVRKKPVKTERSAPKDSLPIVSLKGKLTQDYQRAHRRAFDKRLSAYRRRFRKNGVRVGRSLLIQFPNGERRVMEASRKHRKRKAKKSLEKANVETASAASSVLTRAPVGAAGSVFLSPPLPAGNVFAFPTPASSSGANKGSPNKGKRGPSQKGRTKSIKVSGKKSKNYKSNAPRR